MESITDKDSTDCDASSSSPSHNSVQSGLYSLISIPIFAIIIAILIIFLRKYGCYRCANLVRAVSNYMMDINLGDNISNRTPAEVNEALDNISTEEYGSSPTSTLSWDSRIAVEADRISHIIKDTNISSEISLSPTHINDQGTQTSNQDINVNPEADISNLTNFLNATLSPMDLYPSFTAPIDLESECEDDMTIPMKLDFNPKTNNDIHNVTDSVNDLEGGESEEIVYSVDSGTSEDTNNNVHQSSCTRSGLVYK